MNVRTLAKSWSLTGLRSAGIFSIARRLPYRSRRLLILCYHGLSLSDEDLWSRHLYMSAERFRNRLRLLKSTGANVLPLREGLERLRAGTLPPRSVSITFDDGFQDFYQLAWPALEEFGYPCTVYLTTHYCDYRFPIFNLVVNYLLWKCGRSEVELSDFGLNQTVPLSSYSDRERAVRWICERTDEQQRISTVSKNELALRFAKRLRVDYEDIVRRKMFQIMSAEEASQIAARGCDIQLHTHRHRTPLDRELFLRELTDNARRIEEFTGRHPTEFCYPSGYHRPEFLPWLAEAGIRSATTCDPGLADAESEPLLLPRMLDDSRIENVECEGWISGIVLSSLRL
jgi:peptidoglycan/xylan/chitin deacetylase (PgdA/CDA1 family)